MPSGDVVICCRKLQTLGFLKHLHSYEVVELNQIVLLSYAHLVDYRPLDIYSTKLNGITKKFVTLRYDLSDTEQ